MNQSDAAKVAEIREHSTNKFMQYHNTAMDEVRRCYADIAFLLSLIDRQTAVVEAARDSIGLMCLSGNHAPEGCKQCAVSVALAALDAGREG